MKTGGGNLKLEERGWIWRIGKNGRSEHLRKIMATEDGHYDGEDRVMRALRAERQVALGFSVLQVARAGQRRLRSLREASSDKLRWPRAVVERISL
jgi:hypothetical protein